MKRLLAMLALVAWALSAHALPTAEAVQAEVQRGNYAEAENMMRSVVAAKPDSAKAHYVYAEILAHNGRFDQAAQEARRAKDIDPAVHFTQPEKFTAFEQLLEREQSTAAKARSAAPMVAAQPSPPPAAAHGSGLPGWVWGLGGAAVAVLLWRLLSARRQEQPLQPAAAAGGMPGMPPTYGPGYAAPPAAGSGMLGTGLAAAGGFAAGMLAEKMLEGHHERDLPAGSGRSDGLVPGMFDDAPPRNEAADELEQRSIDFGSGGDWDSGGSIGSGGDGGWDS